MSGFSFGTAPAANTGGATSGFSFNLPSAATATTTANTFSFGSAAPASTAAPFGAPASSSGISFGAPVSSSGISFGAPVSSSGISFGAGAGTGAFGQPQQPAASTGGSLFGSTATPALNLSTSSTFGAPATTAGTATSGFSFATGAAPASTAASSAFSFGMAKPTTSLAGSIATTSTVGAFGTTTTTAPIQFNSGLGTQPNPAGLGVGSAPQGTMTFEELEKKCNEWKKELEFQEESFLKRATQINAWDRLITANAEKITELHEYMKKVKGDQERMDRELDFVVAQQKELEEMLAPLEQEALALESTSIQHHTDFERQTTYNSATTVNAQLRGMAERIKDIIEHINANNKSANDASPISQITQILNAHVDVLQFIQNGIDTLQQKTEDVNKLLGSNRM